jgi:hypothetical protein
MTLDTTVAFGIVFSIGIVALGRSADVNFRNVA